MKIFDKAKAVKNAAIYSANPDIRALCSLHPDIAERTLSAKQLLAWVPVNSGKHFPKRRCQLHDIVRGMMAKNSDDKRVIDTCECIASVLAGYGDCRLAYNKLLNTAYLHPVLSKALIFAVKHGDTDGDSEVAMMEYVSAFFNRNADAMTWLAAVLSNRLVDTRKE